MNELSSVKTNHQNCSIEIEFSSGKPHPLCSLPATAWAAHIQKASDVGGVAVDCAGPSFPPKIRREDESCSVVSHVRRRLGRCGSYGRRGRQGSWVETGTGAAAGWAHGWLAPHHWVVKHVGRRPSSTALPSQ
jgi:hypothetical protein